jgi:hypothetical protein
MSSQKFAFGMIRISIRISMSCKHKICKRMKMELRRQKTRRKNVS